MCVCVCVCVGGGGGLGGGLTQGVDKKHLSRARANLCKMSLL